MRIRPDPSPDAARATVEPRSYLALTPRLSAGEVTPRDVLDGCLSAIERLDPGIGAFVRLATDNARRAADAATERWRGGRPLSPIDGMPVAVKDIIETIDMPTGQGSPLWEGTTTRRDSTGLDGTETRKTVHNGTQRDDGCRISRPPHSTALPTPPRPETPINIGPRAHRVRSKA